MSYNFYFFYYYFMSFINLYSPIAHPSPTPRPPIHPSRARTQTLRAHKQSKQRKRMFLVKSMTRQVLR